MGVPKIHKKIEEFLESRKKAAVREAEAALEAGDGRRLMEIAVATRGYGYRGVFPPEDLVRDLTRLSDADLSFLVRRWRMPFGLDERAVEALLEEFMDQDRFVGKLLDALVAVNPELADIASKDITKGVVIGGCCSRMTINDIVEYMELDTKFEGDGFEVVRKDGSGPEYKRLIDYLTVIGCRPGYFPSLDNLSRACDAVRSDVARITGGRK
jgi:hypothetical protein